MVGSDKDPARGIARNMTNTMKFLSHKHTTAMPYIQSKCRSEQNPAICSQILHQIKKGDEISSPATEDIPVISTHNREKILPNRVISTQFPAWRRRSGTHRMI